jgi:hypothetical protein
MSDWCPENDGAYRAELAAKARAIGEHNTPSPEALIRAALEAGAEKLGDMLYLLSIGSPGDGSFTLQDRTRDEVIDQGVEAIRALKTNPDALAAIKAKAAEGRG